MRLYVCQFALLLGALVIPMHAMAQDAVPAPAYPAGYSPGVAPASYPMAEGYSNCNNCGPNGMRGRHGGNLPGYGYPAPGNHPGFGAHSYPKAHAPAAWPYVGPYYPNPQIPPGWERVSLEWDDGYWWLDFKSKKIDKHHSR